MFLPYRVPREDRHRVPLISTLAVHSLFVVGFYVFGYFYFRISDRFLLIELSRRFCIRIQDFFSRKKLTFFFFVFFLSARESVRKCLDEEKSFWESWTKGRRFEKNWFLLLIDLSKSGIFKNWLVNFRFENERSTIFIIEEFNHFSETNKDRFFEICFISIFDLLFFSACELIVLFCDLCSFQWAN